MKTVFLFPLIILVIVSITSCSNNVGFDKEEEPKISIMQAFISDSKPIRRYIAEKPQELDQHTSATYNSENDKVGRFGGSKNLTVKDWKKLDKRSRVYIEHFEKNIFAHEKVHACVAEALDLYLLRVDNVNDDDELKEAIAYYTDKLVERNTYESGLLAESLKKLEGYWSPDKIEITRKFALTQKAKFSNDRKNYKILGKDLLDEIEFGGEKALEDLVR